MRRRSFVRLSVGGAAGAACLGPLGMAGCDPAGRNAARRLAAPGPHLRRVGIQLYTVRGLMADDVARTLDLVAAVGYHEVEFAGYFGRSPAAIREWVDAAGLSAPAAHVSLPQLREELDALLNAAATVGHRYLVLPSLPAESYDSLDRFRRACAELNEIGDACRTRDIRFAYHNHAVEFAPVEDGVPYDVMLEECDPELVDMEVDFYWMRAGGRDPLEYFESHPGRFALCHVKDMSAGGAMVDVGQGVIEWSAVLAGAATAGVEHFFVEHDEPSDPARSIRRSFEYLTGAEEE